MMLPHQLSQGNFQNTPENPNMIINAREYPQKVNDFTDRALSEIQDENSNRDS